MRRRAPRHRDPHRLRLRHDERRARLRQRSVCAPDGAAEPAGRAHGGDDGYALHRVRARQAARTGGHRPGRLQGHRAALYRKAPGPRLRHPLYARVGRLICSASALHTR